VDSDYVRKTVAVLVTGASGFIGWHLSKALRKRGERVVGLVRRTSEVGQLEPLGIELIHGDVTDPASMQEVIRDVDVVFHLAGVTKGLRYEQMHAINAHGSRNVARACVVNDVRTLVSVSSLAAVGPSRNGAPLCESNVPRPVSNYGRSKLAGERAASEFSDRLRISVVRPSIVIGEYDLASLEMFKSIHNLRLHLVPGFRAKPFSVIHATDLAELLILVAEQGERRDTADSNSGQGVYFAEGDERPTYAEMGDLIGAAINRRFVKLSIGPNVLRVSAALADVAARVRGRPLFFSSDKVREATRGPWICSGEKARRQLGFRNERSLCERFKQTGQWYLKHGWL
jgi:nucleoside-diphosphate-sugar epimerase